MNGNEQLEEGGGLTKAGESHGNMAKSQQRTNIGPPKLIEPKQLDTILDDVHGNDWAITGREEGIGKGQQAEEEEIGISRPKKDAGDQNIANQRNCTEK